MSKQTINIGSGASAGDGESVRSGFNKVNGMFSDAYAHIADLTNPHGVTAAQVGAVATSAVGAANGIATLGLDGKLITAQVPATVPAANKLYAAQTIALAGDAAGSVSFDGSAGVTLTATLAATGATAGTYGRTVVNAKGLVTSVITEYEFNVIEHGVKGDGTTDDRAAFLAVLTLASTRATAIGAPVNLVIPAANYYFSSPIALVSNVRLIGKGKPRITVGGSNGQIFTGTSLSNIVMENLTLDGGRTGGAKASSTAVTCDFQSCSFITLRNVDVINPSGGVHFTSSNNILVADSSVSNSNGHGIFLKTSYDSEVRNCQFNSLVYFGVICTAGCYRIKIVGNRTTANGIELAASTQDCYEIHYMYNHAENTGDNGLSVGGHRNVVVGNVIKGCAGNGIHVYGDRCTIVGNTSVNNAQHYATNSAWRAGIAIENGFGGMSQYNTITGNTLDDDQASPTQQYGVWVGPNVYTLWATGQAITGSGPFNPVYRYYGANLYMCYVDGTTGATPPTHTSGSVSDGGVTWIFVWTALAGTVGCFVNEISSNNVVRFGTAKYGDSSGATGTLVNEISASFQPLVLPSNLTAGSISNPGGVASIAFGGSYQTSNGNPITLAIGAPTVSGGQQATAVVASYFLLGFGSVSVGGSGYAVGDVLQLVGGTCTSASPVQIRVTAVSGGAITTFTANGGTYSYTALPPAGNSFYSTVTGSGSGFQTTASQWHINAITVTSAGSGYASAPTVTASGQTSGTPTFTPSLSSQITISAGAGSILLDSAGTKLGLSGATGTPVLIEGATIDATGTRIALTGSTYTTPQNISLLRLTQTGTIATQTIILPNAVGDGQVLQIVQYGGTVTALTFSPTVGGWTNASQLSPYTGLRIRWDATDSKWYREQ